MIAPGIVNAATDAQAVLLLRTYQSVTSTDEPCLPAGPTEAEDTTLRLNCPSTVHVEAQANEAAGWHMNHQQLAAGPFVLNHYRLTHAGTPTGRAAPLQLLLSW
jgi:hypothetical protein